ncbi:BON domain-containing protein [Roseateles violae]|uniref:BON domain-containing protein n=1 Tax=Roseateles violae TaxID=3058042 RepID=A0ABT8DUF1_9BURK|nr:BON domain-containing protein [Pelomonas sp. PFR6]MDN3921909.1 BON domain-containing protein [Pelomonas sp. PFR6]
MTPCRLSIWLALWLALLLPALAAAQPRANYFNDPFERLSAGIAACPLPAGPLITEAQMRAQAHGRAERGTSCYQAGRCRLPNSYLYDKEIMARVVRAVAADGRFADSSVWATGQRRWIVLQGCVRSREQARALVELLGGVDEVEQVIDELQVRAR